MLRLDFLNNTLLGVGAALLRQPAPAQIRDTFTGYGGVGDYAASNGDPWQVTSVGHKLRDGAYGSNAADTAETFDLIIVAGGLSGLGAAYYFAKATGGRKRCLILENHAMFGGHCKQNEFEVNGQRLIGPQASNDFGVPREGSGNQMDELFTELRIPREFSWQEWDRDLKPLVLQPPGFYYGRERKRPAREIVQQGFGQIAIAHAELNGHQNATGALARGKRAAEQVLAKEI